MSDTCHCGAPVRQHTKRVLVWQTRDAETGQDWCAMAAVGSRPLCAEHWADEFKVALKDLMLDIERSERPDFPGSLKLEPMP